jgi:alpha(1,3/1,4) fucosyltransferase
MLTIGFTDGMHYMMPFFEPALRRAFPGTELRFERDPKVDPDLLVFSVFGGDNRNYDCKKVCVSGEPYDLSHVRCDLLIDCKVNPSLQPGDVRFMYLPFYAVSFAERFTSQPEDLLASGGPSALDRDRFCAFLYWNNVPSRNHLFEAISRYKPVDALGRACAPENQPHDRGHYEPGRSTYNDLAVQKYLGYKFVICGENSIHPGYVTEKIVSARLAGAVPIYVGAPDVAEHFSTASFIHVETSQHIEAALDRIRALDQDRDAYQAIRDAPCFADGKLPKYFDPDYLVPALQALL